MQASLFFVNMRPMKETSNQYIQLTSSPIEGFGIFAKADIKAGTEVIEYVGKRLTKRQSDKQLEELAGSGNHIYTFSLNDKYDIDGDVDYNLAKYINHSCEPNCYTTTDDDKIWIVAKRDIAKGEELSYDYQFDRAHWHEHRCLCQSKDCFGFIVARKHWSGIKKTKRYQRLTD